MALEAKDGKVGLIFTSNNPVIVPLCSLITQSIFLTSNFLHGQN